MSYMFMNIVEGNLGEKVVIQLTIDPGYCGIFRTYSLGRRTSSVFKNRKSRGIGKERNILG
jgi:hypothetical protein